MELSTSLLIGFIIRLFAGIAGIILGAYVSNLVRHPIQVFVFWVLIVMDGVLYQHEMRIIPLQNNDLVEEFEIVRKKPKQQIKPPQLSGTDIPTEKREDACIICVTNKKCCAVIPCGHLLFCISCAKAHPSEKCPMCREPVEKFTRIFN